MKPFFSRDEVFFIVRKSQEIRLPALVIELGLKVGELIFC
jgi:hypothetical protein